MLVALSRAAAPRRSLADRTTARPISLDDASFGRIYAATARPLWAYLARMTGSASSADDLLQETWFRFLRAQASIDSDAHARNYLFRIAANLLRDEHRRRRGRHEEALHEGVGRQPPRPVGVRSDLRDAMGELRGRDRQLLWLAHVEEFSHREIGEILDVREGSVRLMLFRARQRLAAALLRRGIGTEVP